ncbi:MAG: hypothetical protein DRG78_07675 [Epsilonproteobacteria bacterium]|nr:MAG: hypothetical protein DRG78_07675 [Campylobacterota bacterium]
MKYLLLFILTISTLFSQSIILDDKAKVNITPSLLYYLDEYSDFTKQNVLKEEFKKSDSKRLMFGYKYDSTLWAKFSLENHSEETITKIFDYDYPILKEFTLINLDTNKTTSGGFKYNKNYKNTMKQPIKLILQPHSVNHFLLQAKSTDVALMMKVNIWETDSYYTDTNKNQYITFLFLGAIASLLLYNIILFLFTKDINYFYYSLVMLSMLTLKLFLEGFFTFIFPYYEVKQWHLLLLLYLMNLALVMFTIKFLDLKNNMPKIEKVLFVYLLFVTILTILGMFDIVTTEVHRRILLASFYFLVFVGLYAVHKRIAQAKYYVFGWMFLLLFITIEATKQLGFSDFFADYPHLGMVSIFLEALLFSIALAARIRSLQDDKKEALQKLYLLKEKESKEFELEVVNRTKKLNKALEDKSLLLQEVHHRVKNNLQIIISLLRLQIDEIDDTKVQKLLQDSENRVQAISNVHEMLYSNDSLQEINSQEYFQKLVQSIQNSFAIKDIKVFVDSKPFLSMDKAIYCGLIINELVTNAFKYAFDDNTGEIHISLLKIENEYILTMFDNGKGLSSDAKSNLGTILVKTLVKKQLKGSLEVDVSNGTKYIMKFG